MHNFDILQCAESAGDCSFKLVATQIDINQQRESPNRAWDGTSKFVTPEVKHIKSSVRVQKIGNGSVHFVIRN